MKTWQLLVACGYACALARGAVAVEDGSAAADSAVVREPEESDQYIVADESVQQQQLEAFETEFVPEPDPEVVAAQRAAYCLARGFDPETLHCGLCEKMAAFMQPKKDQVAAEIAAEADDEKKQPLQLKLDALTDLTEGCSDCCSETAVDKVDEASGESESAVAQEDELFERVVLEVCTCKFNRYPKIKNFVNKHAKDHKRLEIKYMQGRHAHLIFYDKAGNAHGEINISGWKEETISEYIVSKVKQTDPDPEAAATSSSEGSDAKEQEEETAEEAPVDAKDEL